MTNVKMKALDTLHVSSVSQHSMVAGTEFEVPTHIADDLEKRGLAEKAAEAPANKMDKSPANKSASANKAK